MCFYLSLLLLIVFINVSSDLAKAFVTSSRNKYMENPILRKFPWYRYFLAEMRLAIWSVFSLRKVFPLF